MHSIYTNQNLLILCYLLYLIHCFTSLSNASLPEKNISNLDKAVHIAIVQCGGVSREIFSLINSILLYSNSAIVFHLIFEKASRKAMTLWVRIQY